MNGFHADMALQAMNELSERYGDDRQTLAEQYICMRLCLERTGTIELLEKIHIRERLSMYDQLWEESPTVQKMRQEYRMKGIQEGRQEGLQEGLQKGRQEERKEELQRLQQMLTNIIRAKYPDLVDLALQQANHFDNPDKFLFLIEHVVSASNVDSVRRLLEQQTM